MRFSLASGAAVGIALVAFAALPAKAVPAPDSGPVAGGTMVAVDRGAVFTQVESSNASVYALDNDGLAYSWGAGNSGQLGTGNTQSSNRPVRIAQGALPAGATFTRLVGGTGNAFGFGSDGLLYGWGINQLGQLGDGTTTNHETPVVVAPGALAPGVTIVDVSSGSGYTAVLGSDGNAYVFGTLPGSGVTSNGVTITTTLTPVVVDR